MDARTIYLALIAVALTACGTVQERVRTVRVEIPVAIKSTPPAHLTTPVITGPLPNWISPADVNAQSCLATADEQRLRLLLIDLDGRVKEWEAWATTGNNQ